MCKKYHSWFYPTLKVTENKVLLSLFEILSSLQFLDLHFLNGLFQKEIDLYSVSPRRDTSMRNCDKDFVATETWKFTKKWKLLPLGQAQPLSRIHAFFGWMATGLYALANLVSSCPILLEFGLILRPIRHAKREACKTKVGAWSGNNWKLYSLSFITWIGFVVFIFNVFLPKASAMKLL